MPKTKKNTYHTEWERANIRRIVIKVNLQTETEMADWLEKKPNKQNYIKSLIESDMKKAERTTSQADDD